MTSCHLHRLMICHRHIYLPTTPPPVLQDPIMNHQILHGLLRPMSSKVFIVLCVVVEIYKHKIYMKNVCLKQQEIHEPDIYMYFS